MPALKLNQSVKVIQGKHQGKEGKVSYYHPEGTGGRITLLLSDGSLIYVDKEDVDFKFEWVEIVAMMDEEQRAEFNEVVRRYKEGNNS